MADAKRLLDDALAQLDAVATLERHEVLEALDPAHKTAKEAGEYPDELRYEVIAAELILHDEPIAWGTCFGPWASGVTEGGQRNDLPPFEAITPECISHWSTRMHQAQNPAMRARYADLVWDFSEKVVGTKPTIDAARIAIDGYVEALATGRCEPFDGSENHQKRAFKLALSVNDAGRLQNALTRLTNHAATMPTAEERELRQRLLFSTLMDFPRRRWPDAELITLSRDLRTRLNDLNAVQADQFAIHNIALPLAEYYRSTQQLEEAKTVLRVHGSAVIRMARGAMAILAAAWLTQLYELYLRFEMNEDAAQVMQQIEAVQPSVPANLAKISIPHEIDRAELEEWLGWLVTSDLEASIMRLVCQFVPSVDEARKQMGQLQNENRLMSLFSATIVDHQGRQVARVGAGESDMEGNLCRHILQSVQFVDFHLAAGLDRLFKTHGMTADKLFVEITKSPAWHEKRHTILRRGVEAYFAEDPIVAVHLFVTEIENAVRNIAAALELTLQKRNRMAGFDLKNLGDFLADAKVGEFLTEDVVTYLKIVLTDRRGWNLRNDACHGILPAANFTQAAARRLLHIVLLLSAIRPVAQSPESQPPTVSPPNEGDQGPDPLQL